MKKPLAAPVTAIVTMLILMSLFAIVSIHIAIERRVGPRVDFFRGEQRDHLKEYLEDQAVVAADPVFSQVSSTSADAGPYLNPKLHWTPSIEGMRPDGKDVIEFPEDWREDILADNGRWVRFFFRYNPKPIEFGLFMELRKYDHWRLDENSPIADTMARGRFPNSVGIPLPDLTDLGLLARLYLMRAVETKEALSTLKDVRHLAMLLLTTEHVETEMAGIAMLKTERHAYNFFVKRNLIAKHAWTPVSTESVLRAQRVFLAERTYLHLWTEPSTLKTVFTDHRAVSLCAVVNDAVSDDWSLSGMLRPRIWPEENLAEPYDQLRALVQHAETQGCRVTFIKAKILQNRFPVEAPVPWYVMRTPFVRRLFGLNYATLPPSGFSLPPSTDSN